MRLFLSSHDFGNFAQDLQNLVGDNRKTLVITNAKDFNDPTVRHQKVQEKLKLFRDYGFEPKELDLRPYFSRMPEELEKYVTQYDPGLIFCIGGDLFMLATALAISGMDDIIHHRLEQDKSVYGGYSAGAVVAAENVEVYERDELQVESLPDYYGVEAVASGLGLIDEYIIPHAGTPELTDRTKFYEAQLDNIHAERILLNDGDVYIINNRRKEIKKV